MKLRLHSNQLAIRILGTITGVGFLVVGAYSLLGGSDHPDAYIRDRSFWFGVTVIIAGIWAVAVSWLDSDLTNVWCRPPKRDWRSKGETDSDSG